MTNSDYLYNFTFSSFNNIYRDLKLHEEWMNQEATTFKELSLQPRVSSSVGNASGLELQLQSLLIISLGKI